LLRDKKLLALSFCFLLSYGDFERLTAQVGRAPISVVGAFAANADKMKSIRIRHSDAILDTLAIDNLKRESMIIPKFH